MYFNTKLIVDFCCTHKITINEFFILYLTYKESIIEDPVKKNEEYMLIYKYITEVEGISTNKERIKSLEKRGFCIDKNKDSNPKYFPDQVVLTPKFYNNLFKFLGGASDEVWEAFPGTISIEGKNFPSRTISPEEFEPIYNKAIKNNPETHKKVLIALEKQKQEGNIMCGLKKWIECRYWEIETKGKSLSFNRDV